MQKIVECVPNFSTADRLVIKEITSAIKAVPNVKLLNVEPDKDYNRTVVTFVGTPDYVGKAAVDAIGVASKLIDMSHHKGEHPRMGATDVCPFIPVKDVSMEECVEIAKSVASKVAEEHGVPTYLYGKAATSDARFKLSDIRRGEYEGLKEKILDPEWKPDFGEPVFNEKSGATVVGVRDFLVAYNVNIESPDVAIAKEIGELVRETGRKVEKDGEMVRVPGKFKGIQGMGFTLEKDDRKLTQVSMNVVNFKELTKPHEVFEEVKKLAEERGTQVTGSEIVGLVPKLALLEAGQFYNPDETDERKLVELAVEKFGLSDLDHFDPDKKVIEFIIEKDNLVDLSVDSFLDTVLSKKPAPGGGSVAALGGALSASLVAMVGNLTRGREKFAEVEEDIVKYTAKATKYQEKLKVLVDEDTLAFNQIMDAYKMPKDDPARSEAIQNATIYATKIPLKVAKTSLKVLKLAKKVAEKGNQNAITDAGVAALFAEAAVKGAIYNVKINLGGIKDEKLKEKYDGKAKKYLKEAEEKLAEVKEIVEGAL